MARCGRGITRGGGAARPIIVRKQPRAAWRASRSPKISSARGRMALLGTTARLFQPSMATLR
jgi:hypothetical protein